ncbi:hypothetical protein [Streptomyces sp. NPDC056987]|uniref:hypothetical protein n=1 Tax=Streptomyces sp. NPDC056987 TaxID=3345988 RepID=UPI003639BB02
MDVTDPVSGARAVVSCTLTIDGREYTTQQAYSRSSYRLMKDDPRYWQLIEADIRRALGELITRELAPPVIVQEPDDPTPMPVTHPKQKEAPDA